MRKERTLDGLFPPVRRDLLGITFRDTSRWWYLTELAGALDTSPSSLQRELESLVSSAILELRREGRRTYYRANPNSALFSEVRSIVRKTMGVPAEITEVLAPLASRIVVAWIYGSVARGSDRSDSDVDVLVIGNDLTLEELYRHLGPAERKLKRTINVTLYTPEEFRRKRAAKNAFLQNVFSNERIVLIGSEDVIKAAR